MLGIPPDRLHQLLDGEHRQQDINHPPNGEGQAGRHEEVGISIGKFACGCDLAKGGNAKILLKGKKIKKLEKFSTQVTKNYPHLEVLHPETYQSVAVLNPKNTKKLKVNVVIAEKGVYLAE